VTSLLNDRPAVDYYDAIGSLNRAQPMCNYDNSSAFQVGVDRLLNLTVNQPKTSINKVHLKISNNN